MVARVLSNLGAAGFGALLAVWLAPGAKPAPLAPNEASPDCPARVTWEHCGVPLRSGDLLTREDDERVVESPPNGAESMDELVACALAEGAAVLSDCSEWPCLVAIGYPTSEAYERQACRTTLPPALPTRMGAQVVAGETYRYRTYWLADASILTLWDDQLWSERQKARERVLLRSLRVEVDHARQ